MGSNMRTSYPRLGTRIGVSLLAMLAAYGAGTASAQTVQDLRTPLEQSGYARYTTHDEMWTYLLDLRARSTDMRLATYGKTREGRDLPYAIFSRPLVSTPAEAALLGKPVVLLAANVHGGERTFRESLLILLREIATPGTPENRLLDDMVIVAAPQLNPDGFEATERGQRGNAWGIDLNRDYIKLEHPEIANYVGNLLQPWAPHLYVDGHNGGVYPYHVTYQCPSHATPDQRLTALCDEQIFPMIDRALEERGYKSWYYNVGAPDRERWPTGGFQARIGRNYGGFVNSMGILFESPGWQEIEPGVTAGGIALRTVLDYVQGNAQELVSTVESARRETIAMGVAAEGEVTVEMEYGPEPWRVDYEIQVGQGDQRRAEPVTGAQLIKRPVTLVSRGRPYAYILPREGVEAVAMLRRHGVVVEELLEPAELAVEAYTIADISHAPQYNHAATTQIAVGEVIRTTREFPRGTFVVPTGQTLGRVAAHMLEPETDDNVIYWNTMDAWIPRPAAGGEEPALVPIFKLMTPQALPARMIE